jgi:dihydroflavonol-4-reductase
MILVTGAAGLTGTHLVKSLLAQGEKLRALYRSTIPAALNLPGVEWVKGDILDVVSLEESMQDVQEVYHCAAVVSFNPKKKAQLHQVNVEGTANVVNASLDAGIRKMVFMSSVAALGRIRKDGKPIDESMNWSEETSNSEYGKTKYLAEMEVWRGIGEGLNAVMVNPVIILGAGDWERGSAEVFKSAYDEFPWYTSGSGGFVDVLDVVKAMQLLMKSDISGERFILCGLNTTYRDIFTRIANGFGKKPPHRAVTPLLSELVWRLEAIKSKFTGKDPLLTAETAKTAMADVQFDQSKLLQRFPAFSYTSIENSIERICREYREMYNL